MKWMQVLVLVGACTTTETVRVKRWPTHRPERDAQMQKLERQITILIEHVTKLEAEVAALHGAGTPHEPARTDTAAPPSTPGDSLKAQVPGQSSER
jgi:hypothetical protein